ncbi:hypothetical protein [Nonomuraea polychroma]|uniref:hypothetical protein n=1 Tax=Nonomuraea polychroma TaxID=46176 RepID=UPI0013E2B23F|nr:hypothetical protein [Nonomuraea polychroma]
MPWRLRLLRFPFQIARAHMAYDLTLPNYVNNRRTLGFTDADFADGRSDHLAQLAPLPR